MDPDKIFMVEVYNGHYVIDGISAPRLTLTAGETYTFRLNTPGHPFHITSNPLGGEKNNTGQETGDFTWTPTLGDVGKSLYYQCTKHIKMGYKIRVVKEMAYQNQNTRTSKGPIFHPPLCNDSSKVC
uniref:Blue (type 1) copper domain-containing protein n=1 Tax=viral metagenome TaxID=1070528 RepID=A0A6C0CF50_9ZZZZ